MFHLERCMELGVGSFMQAYPPVPASVSPLYVPSAIINIPVIINQPEIFHCETSTKRAFQVVPFPAEVVRDSTQYAHVRHQCSWYV